MSRRNLLWDEPSLQEVLAQLADPIQGVGDCGTTLCLRVYQMQRYVCGVTNGYRFRLEALSAVGLPTEVFVWQRTPLITDAVVSRDEFACPASPADIEEYPVDAPDDTPGARPFFRLAFADLVFRNLELAADGLRAVLLGLQKLVMTSCLVEAVSAIGDVRIGNGSCASSSSSSSSS